MLQFAGKLSYSWYLWHWPVLVFAGVIVPGASVLVKMCGAGIALCLAGATHYLIENPIRQSRYLQPRTALSLCMGMVLTAGGIGTATVWKSSSTKAASGSRQSNLITAAGEMPLRHDGCVTGYADATVRACAFGDLSAQNVVVLFGDSHVEQWFAAVKQVADGAHWRLTTMLKGACPSIRVPVFNPTLRRWEDECSTWREDALSKILKLRPSLVILSNSSGYIQKPGTMPAGFSRLTYRQWSDGTRSVLASLSDAGIRTMLIRDTPVPGFDMLTCLSRLADHPQFFPRDLCTIPRAAGLDDHAWEAEQAAAKYLANVTTVDMTDRFCDGNECPPLRDGQVVYRDTNHISYGFAQRQSSVLADRIGQIMNTSPMRNRGAE
jgi:hypothetical protein